jgi:hypothetical protein
MLRANCSSIRQLWTHHRAVAVRRAHRAAKAMADVEEAPKDRVGFGRAEMFSEPLVGTVKTYHTHVFVCSHLSAREWSHDTTKEATSAHALLDAALAASGEQAAALGKPKTTLFAAEAGDRPGDVLLFPANKRLRPASDMVAQPSAWAAEVVSLLLSPAAGEALPVGTAHVFVCAHARRDKRCGVCGPALIESLRSGAESRGKAGGVAVRACSHVGGHAYAGNVLVFAPRAGGQEVVGDWFGYVAPGDVDALLDTRIAGGAILPKLWRGCMGMTPEQCTAECAGCV